jgi:hypothetical protein
MALTELIADPAGRMTDIAALLDALDGEERWTLLSRLDRDQQRSLFRKADATGMDLTHLVPVTAAPRIEVIHEGLNTLPVPARLRRFQKRFCRPDDSAGDRLFGYNEGPTRRAFGPGYFVARATADRPEWREQGGVVVDYFETPDPGAVLPAGWPRVVPNSRGLQRFVYHQTRDFLRRVSVHVCIGAAFKRERSLDHYFVLCRRS